MHWTILIFISTEHKIIFQVLKNAYKNDKPADIHLVAKSSSVKTNLTAMGGLAYITTLAQYAGTSAYIEEYVELVHNKSILRKMIHAAQIIEKTALEEPQDVNVALDEAQQLFFQISQSANPTAGVLITDIFSGLKAESKSPS